MYAGSIAAALAVSACTYPSYTTELARLDSAPLCCRGDSRDFPVSGALHKELLVSLTSASPVFMFPSGRSRGYAFSLPEMSSPYQIQLAALPMGDVPFKPSGDLGQQYLYPALLFLDEDGKTLVDSYDNQLVAVCPVGRSCRYRLTAVVNPPPEARYGVLHTLYAKIGLYYSSTPQSGPGNPVTGELFLYTGKPEQVFGQFFAVGDVLVSVRKPPAPMPSRKPPEQ